MENEDKEKEIDSMKKGFQAKYVSLQFFNPFSSDV
jgi:hypothetical protein